MAEPDLHIFALLRQFHRNIQRGEMGEGLGAFCADLQLLFQQIPVLAVGLQPRLQVRQVIPRARARPSAKVGSTTGISNLGQSFDLLHQRAQGFSSFSAA